MLKHFLLLDHCEDYPEIEFIKFRNEKHPIRTVSFPFGDRVVSTTRLNDALMNKNMGYVSENACMIDEDIFYFVDENDLYLSEAKLTLKIMDEI